MGLTSWQGAPNSKIHKYDVVIAKNYLNETEIGQLERMVSAYLDLAEILLTAKDRKIIKLNFNVQLKQ